MQSPRGTGYTETMRNSTTPDVRISFKPLQLVPPHEVYERMSTAEWRATVMEARILVARALIAARSAAE